MIYYSIPWNTDKNIGVAYNSFMELLSDDDYACFIDADAMFTTVRFGEQLEAIVKEYPECGCFTSMTNRIGCLWQRTGNWNSNEISYHRAFGEDLASHNYITIEDVSNVPKMEVMGGVLILLKKSLWKKVGGFKEEGMLGIDNNLHWKMMANKEKVYLMKGVYLYHWYRGGLGNKEHLL